MHLDCQLDAAGAVTNPNDDLNTTRVTRHLLLPAQVRRGLISHFSTTAVSTPDCIRRRPAPGVITSANGSPDTKGWIVEVNYLPWLNTKLSLQYTTYDLVQWRQQNYDGFGRNASANGSTYLLLWLTF